MPRIETTEILCNTIRELRKKNKIKASDLATAVNKTPAFITKLENNQFKTIDFNDLIKIFEIISNTQDENKICEDILDTLSVKYSTEEIKKQLWFINFDTVQRIIPVPDEYIQYVKKEINNLNIDSSYLLERINSNEQLDDTLKKQYRNIRNSWIHSTSENCSIIIIHISNQLFSDLLNRKVSRSNYITLFSIVFYLQKIRFYKNCDVLSNEVYNKIFSNTTNILKDYNIYTLSDRGPLIDFTSENTNEILSINDENAKSTIHKILKYYLGIADIDIEYANKIFSNYEKNLEWDLGFTFAIMSLEFFDLQTISYENKKELFEKIKSLLSKYKKLTHSEILVDKYID